MGKKLMLFTTKGMNLDLSVSKFNPEFSFENHNLRLSTNESNTLMSWVTEKGTSPVNIVNKDINGNFLEWEKGENKRILIEEIHGRPLGTAIINNKLVLFTHEEIEEPLLIAPKKEVLESSTSRFDQQEEWYVRGTISGGLEIEGTEVKGCISSAISVPSYVKSVANNVSFPKNCTVTLHSKSLVGNLPDLFKNITQFVINSSEVDFTKQTFKGFNGEITINSNIPPAIDDTSFDEAGFTINIPYGTEQTYVLAGYKKEWLRTSSYTPDSTRCDHIYLLKYADENKNSMIGIELFGGNLDFNLNYPLETLTSYESSDVQKVYWLDGINQTRLINVADLSRSYYRNSTPINSSFDFIPELALLEKVSVRKTYNNSGEFPSGTILYAFTYYNLHGLETNIFYTTPLLYITHYTRGGAPDEKIPCEFNILISNLDTKFDYIRIYSIIRTSLNGTPIVKRVQDIKVSALISEVNDTAFNDLTGVDLYLYTVGEPDKPSEITEGNMTIALFSNDEYPTEDSFVDIDKLLDSFSSELISEIKHSLPQIYMGEDEIPDECKFNNLGTLPKTMYIDEDWEKTRYLDELDELDASDKEASKVKKNKEEDPLKFKEDNYLIINYTDYPKCFEVDVENPSNCYFCNTDYDSNSEKFILRHEFSGNIEIPETITVNGESCNVIGTLEDALRGCEEIVKIKLPNIDIGDRTFLGCTGLEEINFSDVTNIKTIKSDTFRDCTSLHSVSIPDSVTTLEAGAFYGSGLTSIEISEKITSIGLVVFKDCKLLRSVTILEEENSNIKIEKDAFQGCTGIESLNLNCKKIDNWFNASIQSLSTLIIGDNSIILATDAFNNYTNLSRVTIGKSDINNNIDISIFSGCDNITYFVSNRNIINNESITLKNLRHLEVIGPATTIAASAFRYSSNLIEVEFGENIEFIGSNAFSSCSNLKTITSYNPTPPKLCDNDEYSAGAFSHSKLTIYVPEYAVDLYEQNEDWCNEGKGGLYDSEFIAISDKRVLVNGIYYLLSANIASVTSGPQADYYSGTVNIPNTITYKEQSYKVAQIQSKAFSGCGALETIYLPSNVQEVSSIGNDAFEDCDNLTTVNIDSADLVEQDKNADESFSKIFGDLVKTYNINKEVHRIGNHSFDGCSLLLEFIIPNQVSKIGEYAFKESALNSIIIRNSVISIGRSAFEKCESMSQVIIGKIVETIGEKAFYDCNYLLKVICRNEDDSKIVNINNTNIFSNIHNKCILYVHPNKINTYQTNGWTSDVFKGGVVGFIDPRFDSKNILPIEHYYYTFSKANFKNLVININNSFYTWDNPYDEEANEDVTLYYFPYKTTFKDKDNSNTTIVGRSYMGLFIGEKTEPEDNVSRISLRKFILKKKDTSIHYYVSGTLGTPYVFKDSAVNESNGEICYSSNGQRWNTIDKYKDHKKSDDRKWPDYWNVGDNIYLHSSHQDYTNNYSKYCYCWELKRGSRDDIYFKFASSRGELYFRILKDLFSSTANYDSEHDGKLFVYLFYEGYYTKNNDNTYTHHPGATIWVVYRTSLGINYEYENKTILILSKEVPGDTIAFIDTNMSGEIVDPMHLIYLGGESIIAQTMKDKDGTLFLGNLKLKRPAVDSWIKNELLTKTGILKCQDNNLVYDEDFPIIKNAVNCVLSERKFTSVENRYIYTLSTPLGVEYNGASAFKAREYYRLGILFLYKTGRWSEPCWIGDKQWVSDTEYGPSAKLKTIDSNIEVGALKVPEFEFTINADKSEDKDILSALYKLGYRRIRAVYAQPKFSDRTVVYLGITCPTLYRGCDRDLGIYAQSSWLFRAKFKPSETTGFVDEDNIGGSVGYSLKLPSFYPYYEDVELKDEVIDDDGWKLRPALNEVNWYGKTHTNDNGDTVNVNVIMPYYRSTEVMGSYEYKDVYQIDNKCITFHSPDIELSNSNIDSLDTSSINLSSIGYAKLTTTYGDIDILTSTPTFGTGAGFVHKFMKLKGTSALISGNFYEDSVVCAERNEDNNLIEYKALLYASPTYWPVCMWHKKGSLNNDVIRENRSANLLKKKISNFRLADTTTYNKFLIPLICKDILLFNGTEAGHIIKIKGTFNEDTDNIKADVYLGCVDTMVVPTRPSFHYLGFNLIAELKGWIVKSKLINSFGLVPTLRTFKNDVYSNDETGYVYILSTNDNDLVFNKEKGDGGGKGYTDTSIWCRVGRGIYSDNIPNLGKNVRELVYFKEGVPIKYKSTPHLVISGLDKELTSLEESDGEIPVFEITRGYNKNTIFGGVSEDAFNEATWIPCGPVVNITPMNDTKIEFKWGDTYFLRYECLKTYAYTPEDLNQVVEIGSFMLETRTNVDGRYDRNRALVSNLNASPKNFNLINPVYSQQDNFFSYKIMPEEFYHDTYYPNQVTWTLTKISGADVDAWTSINMTSALELDGSVGEVTKLLRFKDLLIAFQDNGISLILYNENVQISSNEGVPIEIANSGKVQGKRYFSNTIGCSNKWSIVDNASGIYFMDSTDKSIYLFNGQLNNLSTTMGFNTWSKDNIPSLSYKWTPMQFNNFITYYDAINQDILFVGAESALAFSEKFGNFTSFYDYGNIPFFCNFEGTGIWIDKDSKIWKHNGGDYCKFFNKNKPYSIILIGNPEPLTDKIFTNLEFRANTDGDLSIPFDTLETWNEYQRGIARLSVKDGLEAMQHNLKDKTASLNRKFRIWRCDIPRDNDNSNGRKAHPMDRMRNPWIYLKLEKKAESNSNKSLPRVEIHDMVMTYFN